MLKPIVTWALLLKTKESWKSNRSLQQSDLLKPTYAKVWNNISPTPSNEDADLSPKDLKLFYPKDIKSKYQDRAEYFRL